MLDVSNITKKYTKGGDSIYALNGVTFATEPGKLIAVKGASGCGKTTLLLTLGGMLRPTGGTINLDTKDLYAYSASERASVRRSQIGFVFQMFHLVPYLTVRENVQLAVESGDADVLGWLDRLGMTHRANHRPSELSAGERQRTAVARALVNRPKLVLADEPTGNLDPENAGVVMEHLRQYATEEGGIVMVVTHGNDADDLADSILSMRDGKLV